MIKVTVKISIQTIETTATIGSNHAPKLENRKKGEEKVVTWPSDKFSHYSESES